MKQVASNTNSAFWLAAVGLLLANGWIAWTCWTQWDQAQVAQTQLVHLERVAQKIETLRQKPLKIGQTVGNDFEVQDGIKPGYKIIISGTQFLLDGAPVIPLS